MEDDVQKLQLRITELENQLKAAGGPQANIDPEDMKIFNKVSQQLGIGSQASTSFVCYNCYNCYSCYNCYNCYVCQRCIFECTCGPCIQYQPTTLAGMRFSSLG
jgi:hypothetical protein